MPCIVGPATAHAGGPVGSDARVFVVIRATTGCGGQRRISGARRFREAEPVDAKPQRNMDCGSRTRLGVRRVRLPAARHWSLLALRVRVTATRRATFLERVS